MQRNILILVIALTSCHCSPQEIHGPQLPPPIHDHSHQGAVPILPLQPLHIPHNHHAHPIPHHNHHDHPIHEQQFPPLTHTEAFIHQHPIHDHPLSQHEHSIVHQLPIQGPNPIPHHGHPVIQQVPIHEEHHYQHHPVHIQPEYFTPPRYDFGYNIFDPHTGDIKNQYEHRNGGFVRGTYSFIEADGQRRIVEYSSDPSTGFNALVRHEPLGGRRGPF